MSTVVLDIVLVFISYVLIPRAIFCIPSQDARHKALNTCGPHAFHGPGIFTTLTQRFGHHIAHHIHVLLGSVFILTPPMLNPIIYEVKTKQNWDQVVYVLLLK